jgi:hypothetical protein
MMSEESSKNQDPKAKFREALEKKKNKGSNPGSQGSAGSKVGQGQQGGAAPKMFRRKAGG